jgi:hypothetical protein
MTPGTELCWPSDVERLNASLRAGPIPNESFDPLIEAAVSGHASPTGGEP